METLTQITAHLVNIVTHCVNPFFTGHGRDCLLCTAPASSSSCRPPRSLLLSVAHPTESELVGFSALSKRLDVIGDCPSQFTMIVRETLFQLQRFGYRSSLPPTVFTSHHWVLCFRDDWECTLSVGLTRRLVVITSCPRQTSPYANVTMIQLSQLPHLNAVIARTDGRVMLSHILDGSSSDHSVLI